MPKSVVDKIVLADMCCGCGTCAGICPSDSLEMAFNKYGEYQPHLIGECSDCGLCLKVCPFNDNTEDELADDLFSLVSNIKKDDVLGYYHTCLMGFANRDGIREKGASGGMVTLLLTLLLEQGEIDGAVVVGPSDRKGIRFESRIVRSVEEIQACAKSKYYPIEHSQVLKQIQKEDGKYAIAGLPCHIYGIRKAQKHNKKLRERIRYIFGLICGHGVSAHFTDFLIQCAQIPKDEVSTIEYRDMKGASGAWNYNFMVVPRSGASKAVRIKMAGGSPFYEAWMKRMFVPKACDFCDDVFSELADVSFMDAWLPEKIKDVLGTSIVASRSVPMTTLLEDIAARKLCELVEINADIAVRSQTQVGVVGYKRDRMPSRLWMVKKMGGCIPERRNKPFSPQSKSMYWEFAAITWNRWLSRRVFHNRLVRQILGHRITKIGCPLTPYHLLRQIREIVAWPLALGKKIIKKTTKVSLRK